MRSIYVARKVLISKPLPIALIKLLDSNLREFEKQKLYINEQEIQLIYIF